MTEHGFSDGVAGRWMTAAQQTLDRIEQTQMDAIRATSEMCADAIAAGGMAHLFGTGHSRIPLEEMFPRYGSYPGFHPMADGNKDWPDAPPRPHHSADLLATV